MGKAEAGGHSGITTSTAGGGGSAITASTAAAGGDGGGGGLGIEAGLGGRSVGTSKLDDGSKPIEVDDIGGAQRKTAMTSPSTYLPNQSSLGGGVAHQEDRGPQENPASSAHPSPSSRVQVQKTV